MKPLDIGSAVRIVCEDDPRCGEVGTVINVGKGESSGLTFYLVSLSHDAQWYLGCEIKSV
jgi:hypothetical protein